MLRITIELLPHGDARRALMWIETRASCEDGPFAERIEGVAKDAFLASQTAGVDD